MGKQGPCNHCGVTSTPLWRNGPPEKPVLCNACGSRWRTKGTLSNYTPLHSRAEHEDFDGRGFSKVKIMSIKKKEVNFQKRKLNTNQDLDIGKFVIKLNRVLLPAKSNDEGDSGSAISSSEFTCPTQWDANTTVPSRKRTCFGRPKSSSIEKLAKDLYTILNEQRQSSHLFGSLEEDLIFDTDFLPMGHGSVLIGHPSSSVREEESETSSLSIENHPNSESYNKLKDPKEGTLMNKVGENEESCCFIPRMDENSSLMFDDSSSQLVQDQYSDYDLLLDLPSNSSFPEAELLM